ncbi:hypothetical protein HY339_00775 [Candidatus Gottesmanbacteria bacterium]|nr:hypothetical protein [Candidatus Gottesmanbacteria bacterium]
MNVLRKYARRWERRIVLTKRQQFVVITLTLTGGLIVTQVVPTELRYPLVGIFSIATYLFSAFGLREDLRGAEWVTLLTLPTLFTAAALLFYFLLPVRWLTRLPVAAAYAVGMYALLLTENIYNVAAQRSIALLRAARSVGFLLTLVTYFLLVSTILSFRLAVGWTSVAVGAVTFLLTLQALWAVELEPRVSARAWQVSGAMTIVMSELAWVFGFWPVQQTLIVLFLTTMLYCTVGMAQAYIEDKLYKKTAIEFGSVAIIVFVILSIATRWRGFV